MEFFEAIDVFGVELRCYSDWQRVRAPHMIPRDGPRLSCGGVRGEASGLEVGTGRGQLGLAAPIDSHLADL